MNEYEVYVVQLFNSFQYSKTWVDQKICCSFEQAKKAVELYKTQKWSFTTKIRILHRVIVDRTLEEDNLLCLDQK